MARVAYVDRDLMAFNVREEDSEEVADALTTIISTQCMVEYGMLAVILE